MLLSSGFNFHCENLSRTEKTNQGEKKYTFDFSLLHPFRQRQWNEMLERGTRLRLVLHFLLLPSGWQQWAESPNRRLPLSDYNLWSISIIGGVCRDSYSNNYLDWSVSKATNVPIHPEWGEGKCLCVCKCIASHGGGKKGSRGTSALFLALNTSTKIPAYSEFKHVQAMTWDFLLKKKSWDFQCFDNFLKNNLYRNNKLVVFYFDP